jgi:hypothetical protein
VLDRLKPFMEGGPGFIVFDSHLGIARRMWLGLTWLLEDTRGLPQPTGSKTAPAYVGACAFCEVRGIRHGKTSVYVSAIAHSRNAAIKARFALEHAASPDLLALAAAPPPARMTSAKATASAQRVQGGAPAAEEPYKSLNPYYVVLGADWDFLGCAPVYLYSVFIIWFARLNLYIAPSFTCFACNNTRSVCTGAPCMTSRMASGIWQRMSLTS